MKLIRLLFVVLLVGNSLFAMQSGGNIPAQIGASVAPEVALERHSDAGSAGSLSGPPERFAEKTVVIPYAQDDVGAKTGCTAIDMYAATQLLCVDQNLLNQQALKTFIDEGARRYLALPLALRRAHNGFFDAQDLQDRFPELKLLDDYIRIVSDAQAQDCPPDEREFTVSLSSLATKLQTCAEREKCSVAAVYSYAGDRSSLFCYKNDTHRWLFFDSHGPCRFFVFKSVHDMQVFVKEYALFACAGYNGEALSLSLFKLANPAAQPADITLKALASDTPVEAPIRPVPQPQPQPLSIRRGPDWFNLLSVLCGEVTAQYLTRRTRVPFAGVAYDVGFLLATNSGRVPSAMTAPMLALRMCLLGLDAAHAWRSKTSSRLWTGLGGLAMAFWGRSNAGACSELRDRHLLDRSAATYTAKYGVPIALGGYTFLRWRRG